MTVHNAKFEGMAIASDIMVTSFRTVFSAFVSPETMDACTNPDSCRAMLMEALKQIGDRPVHLWAFKENTRARRFYEKYGLHWDGTERVSEFDGALEVRYVRRDIGAVGFDGYIQCLTERQERELRILSVLPVESLVLENPQRDWKASHEQLTDAVQAAV